MGEEALMFEHNHPQIVERSMFVLESGRNNSGQR
jgi:hypothetical protein